MKKKLTNEQMNTQNYRYKKKTPPVDEFASMNGPVTIRTIELASKPLPVFVTPKPITALTCSKCKYVATSVLDSKRHWLDHD